MASPTNSHPSTVSEPAETREVRVREYQVEMLEESLRANVIVVVMMIVHPKIGKMLTHRKMPTGTGKTEMYVLYHHSNQMTDRTNRAIQRIQNDVYKGDPEKAPTVTYSRNAIANKR